MVKHSALAKNNHTRNQINEFDLIQSEINQIFNEHLASPFLFTKDTNSQMLKPLIDLSENDKEVKISAELPDMNTQDIHLKVSDDGYLTISGKKTNSNTHTDDGYYFSERSYGVVHRTIALPADVNMDKITAKFEKGVLKINIPKNEKAQQKMKEIQIQE